MQRIGERQIGKQKELDGSPSVELKNLDTVDERGFKRKINWVLPSSEGTKMLLNLLALTRRRATTCDQVVRSLHELQQEIPTIGVNFLQSLALQATNFNNCRLATALIGISM